MVSAKPLVVGARPLVVGAKPLGWHSGLVFGGEDVSDGMLMSSARASCLRLGVCTCGACDGRVGLSLAVHVRVSQGECRETCNGEEELAPREGLQCIGTHMGRDGRSDRSACAHGAPVCCKPVGRSPGDGWWRWWNGGRMAMEETIGGETVEARGWELKIGDCSAVERGGVA